jgi:glycosyltransferase involved in cell wall biosynthesis
MTRPWAINGRFLLQPATGVQRYAAEVVRALDRLKAEGSPLTDGLGFEILVPPGQRRDLGLCAIPVRTVGASGGHLWEQAVLPRAVSGGLLSLCNTAPVALRRQIVCIHDANTWNFPASYSLPFRVAYRTLLPALGQSAARVATVSHYSARELVRHGVTSTEKLFVAPNGHEHVLAITPGHSDETAAVATRRTVAVVGSRAPHKNVELVVGLAGRLAAEGLSVVIVGASDPRVFRAGRDLTAGSVICVGRIGDAEMLALLRDCLCLAFPSFEEGFGLPPLEAMAIGCPVVASDRASMPEVCGDAALYAAPDAPDAWLSALVRLGRDHELRSTLVQRGRRRAGLYRWADTASRYLASIREIEELPVIRAAPATGMAPVS